MFGDVAAFSVAQYGIEEMRKRLLENCATTFEGLSNGKAMDVHCPKKFLADAVVEEFETRRKQFVRSEKNPDGTYEIAIHKTGGSF